jgi:hypothetical protein
MNQSTDSAETPKPSDTNMYVCVRDETYIVGPPSTLEDALVRARYHGGKVYLLVKMPTVEEARQVQQRLEDQREWDRRKAELIHGSRNEIPRSMHKPSSNT